MNIKKFREWTKETVKKFEHDGNKYYVTEFNIMASNRTFDEILKDNEKDFGKLVAKRLNEQEIINIFIHEICEIPTKEEIRDALNKSNDSEDYKIAYDMLKDIYKKINMEF
jgi:predicted metallopeptidase